MGERSSATLLLPWLEGPLTELLTGRDRLHHALLLHGPAGIGKQQFALSLSASLLCEKSDRAGLLACGACPACHWMSEGSHPDFRFVRPEAHDPDFVPARSRKPSSDIKIDQIRALSSFLSVGSHRDGWRVVLIHPAQAMNFVTANGLLKTLEEPGANTLIILVSSQPNRLTPTVRSRCRQIRLPAPDTDQAVSWLLANGMTDESSARGALAATGAPLSALDFADPAVATAHQAILETVSALPDTAELRAVEALDRHEPIRWASVLQRWISDLARVSAGAAPHYFPAFADRLLQLSARTRLDHLTRLQTRLLDLNARIDHPLNARMICESTILAYCQVFERSGRI
ncbi:MAG: DNA polymerase III subunit delta' [Burkholderiaceae bacterium]